MRGHNKKERKSVKNNIMKHPINYIKGLVGAALIAAAATTGAINAEAKSVASGHNGNLEAASDSSAVVMTIDGQDVSLADYLYLYNKNRDQQLSPMSRRDYLDLFVLYKLKVIEAREQGLDTTASFVNEFKGYRRDLARQYVSDQRVREMVAEGGGRLTVRAVDKECDSLERFEPAYRRLIEEYHEGMLLFEISDRMVWKRAREDREGLTEYYEANKEAYRWSEPRIKGYVLWTENDSTAEAVKASVEALKELTDAETVKELRRRHGRHVKIEHYLVKQGENPTLDALLAGQPASSADQRWTNGIAMRLRLVEQPEGIADVRGKLTNDYQEYLAKAWESALRRRHVVMVDYNVLDEE